MSGLKILQVINVRWYNAEADYALKLSRSLKALGADVTVMGLAGSPVIELAEKEGLKTLTDIDLNSQNPFSVMLNYNMFKTTLWREKFDIVNFHRSEGFIVGAMVCKKAGAKIVRTRGDMRPVRKGFINKLLYNGMTDMIITSGDIIKASLKERLGCSDNKMRTVYTAVDTEMFSPEKRSDRLKEELAVSDNTRIVSILGRLGNVKGHDHFLRAAKLVKDKADNVVFLIVGKEVDREAGGVKRLVAELGLKADVRFIIGRRDDISGIAASVDVGVITSTASEANCRVALEWMSSGVPIVAFDTGVIPEVVADVDTGYVVPTGDEKALATKIAALLNDGGTVELFKKHAREKAVNNFDIKVLGAKTLKIYNDLLG